MTKDPIRSWAERYNLERGEGPSSRSLAAQRAHLLLAYSRRRQERRTFPWAHLGAAAFALGIALAVFLGTRATRSEEPLFRGAALAVGASVEAGTGKERITVPGGSVVELEARARARLAELSGKRVEWTVLDGEVAFDVRRKEGTAWTVNAGPYRVRVLGTAFAVNFERKRGVFSVRVGRGVVRVEGPDVPENLVLTAGQRFDANRAEPNVENPRETEETAAGEKRVGENRALDDRAPGDRVSETSASGSARRGSPSSNRPPTSAPSASTPSWQTLARAGDYRGAFAVVQKSGFDGVLAAASADDRILLGNTARFSGDSAAAERAYLGARATGVASAKSLAAYYLARIALDGHRSSGEAIRWLRTFLQEDPGGELAASARARLIDLLQRTGDRAGARQTAFEYLRLHPNGPHAPLARSLTAEATP